MALFLAAKDSAMITAQQLLVGGGWANQLAAAIPKLPVAFPPRFRHCLDVSGTAAFGKSETRSEWPIWGAKLPLPH
jgi:hypothetical protein